MRGARLLTDPGLGDPGQATALAVAGAEAAEGLAVALEDEWALYTPQQVAVPACALFARITAAGAAPEKLDECWSFSWRHQGPGPLTTFSSVAGMPYAASSSRVPGRRRPPARVWALRGALDINPAPGRVFLVGVHSTVRTRSISTATALAVLFSSAALSVVVTAGSASAVTVGSSWGMVVDGARHRVFIGDDARGQIVAADYGGNRVDSVSGIDGVADLALSEDGSILYAAARVSHEIVALDPATLDVEARYPVAAGIGPLYVEAAGGKVWFTYGEWGGQREAGLGSVDPAVDPASGTDPVSLGQLPLPNHGVTSPAFLDTDPSAPGLLAVGQRDFYDSAKQLLAVVDVSGPTPQLVASQSGGPTLYVNDVDLVPGNPAVLGGATKRYAYAGGAFTDTASYPFGQRADVAPNGLVAQVGSVEENRVSIYRPGESKAVRTYALDASQVAWTADASRLFVLVSSPGGYTLRVLTNPALSVPAITVNAPSTATRAKPLTVVGKVTATVKLPAGAQLKVTRTDMEHPNGKTLPAVTVKADGTYSFSDTPSSGGTVTYRVSYAGDAEHTTASAHDNVSVSRVTPSLSLNNNGKVYAYGTDVRFTAHLGTTYKNRTVEIWADPFGSDRPKKLVKSGTVNSDGNISAVLDMARDTSVYAVFKGDSRYKPRTVKVTAYAKVRVSTAVSRHYKTGKIGSTTYHWFRKSTNPRLTTSMTYYPGRHQRFDLQMYYQGSWHSLDSQYFALGTNGKSVVELGAPGEAGVKVRMRSVYVNGSSGDSVNSTTYGGWKYLYFSN
ncbi:YncE family protein [Streptomyces sp. NPDC007904]|uniref:YncE family protein n=1 Tax=Streptomyces sp. NPDC007904 TaxID=3364787 RepID=UPI0036E3E27E